MWKKQERDTQPPYEYSRNTDNLQFGSQHTIQAKAYDNAGNVGVSNIVTVTIEDIQAPQITITNPQNGQIVSGTVLIHASVIDIVGSSKGIISKAPNGILKVEFFIDGNLIYEDYQIPNEYSWDTLKIDNGYHTITVKAYDNMNNIGGAKNLCWDLCIFYSANNRWWLYCRWIYKFIWIRIL